MKLNRYQTNGRNISLATKNGLNVGLVMALQGIAEKGLLIQLLPG